MGCDDFQGVFGVMLVCGLLIPRCISFLSIDS